MTEVVARGFWVARCTCEVFPDPVICVPKECISTCFEQFSVECYERPSINDVVNLPRLRNDGIYCTRSNEGQLAQGTASIVRNRTSVSIASRSQTTPSGDERTDRGSERCEGRASEQLSRMCAPRVCW